MSEIITDGINQDHHLWRNFMLKDADPKGGRDWDEADESDEGADEHDDSDLDDDGRTTERSRDDASSSWEDPDRRWGR